MGAVAGHILISRSPAGRRGRAAYHSVSVALGAAGTVVWAPFRWGRRGAVGGAGKATTGQVVPEVSARTRRRRLAVARASYHKIEDFSPVITV